MALTNVPNSLQCDFLKRGHVCQTHIHLLFEAEELLHMLLLHRNDFALDGVQTFLKKLEEFARIIMEPAALVRIVIQELQQIDLNVVVKSWVPLHHDPPHLVHVVFL